MNKKADCDGTISQCRLWARGEPVLEAYHDDEWCRINYDDRFQFEMLCLEGASAGLSLKTIMHKREAYKTAFHSFEIELCTAMNDDELEALLFNPCLINKIFSVRKNAKAVDKIRAEFGSFDKYLWHFTNGKQISGG